MKNIIDSAIRKIDELSKTKPIKIISHYDTDGITSAAIFSRALQRWNKNFSLEIVKGLEEPFINSLPESNILIFLDLASNSLNYLKNKKTDIFILDHHEIVQEIPSNITMINPRISLGENVSTAAICYLFAKALSHHNQDLANLAIIGMIGDVLEKNIGKTYTEILNDSETFVKKGLLIYPATRPLDRALEYSSNPFIPGVTGSFRGVMELLKEIGIQKTSKDYKSISELTEDEMSRLITAVMLRSLGKEKMDEIIGNIYLIKFFNKMEDARELSALINACSRMDQPYVCLGFCLGNRAAKEKAEKIYAEYKQHLIAGLKYVTENEKIEGKKYMIINAKDKIKDTIIGTIASILSHSPVCEAGTIIVALAYNQDKIKVSARIAGREGRNVRDVLNQVVVPLGGEVGGHPMAAGCLIQKEHETAFLSEIQKVLEIQLPPPSIPSTTSDIN